MTEPITSPHNPRVRAVVALRDRRGRQAANRIVIDGAREVHRALRAGVAVETLFVADGGCRSEDCRAALTLARRGRVEIVVLGARAYERAAFGDRADGLIAVAMPPDTSLAALSLPPEPLLIVLEGVEKPGNLGAVLRSADGAGADAVIVTGEGTDAWNPNAIRASLGTIFHVPLAVAGAEEAVAWLRERGVRLVAARVDGALDYARADLTGPLAIALGAEAAGLTAAFAGPDVTAVRLPMLGIADSLNVSVTAAILLYEARRQRGHPPSRAL